MVIAQASHVFRTTVWSGLKGVDCLIFLLQITRKTVKVYGTGEQVYTFPVKLTLIVPTLLDFKNSPDNQESG